jgi:hypothetical protein
MVPLSVVIVVVFVSFLFVPITLLEHYAEILNPSRGQTLRTCQSWFCFYRQSKRLKTCRNVERFPSALITERPRGAATTTVAQSCSANPFCSFKFACSGLFFYPHDVH